jgi:hypothetical protein
LLCRASADVSSVGRRKRRHQVAIREAQALVPIHQQLYTFGLWTMIAYLKNIQMYTLSIQ